MIPALTSWSAGSDPSEWWILHVGLPALEGRDIQSENSSKTKLATGDSRNRLICYLISCSRSEINPIGRIQKP